MMRQLIRVATSLLFAPAVTAAVHPAWGQDSVQAGTRSINGMQMYYEIRGSGPPLVLLHGFTGCGRTWAPHIQPLAEHFRLIIPDLRGHGRSTNPSGQFTHRQSALDIFALLDQLGIRRFKAIGWSTGGMTLLHMATQQPDRVEAMVLIGATTYFPEQARIIMRTANPDSVAAHPSVSLRECHVRGATQIHDLLSQFQQFKDSYDDMTFTDPALATIAARTLIVHGDRDRFFPVTIAVQMYQAIPHSYLWIIPNGGHGPISGGHEREFQEEAVAFLEGQWEAKP